MKTIARVISVLLHPAILQCIFLLYPYPNGNLGAYELSVVLFLSALFPLLVSVLYFYYTGITDYYTIPANKRYIPFLLSLSGLIMAWVFMQGTNSEISIRLILIILFNITAGIITPFEKISLHTFALTLICVLWFGAFGILPFLLLIPVIWARLYLKSHNPKQIILGFGMGIALGLLFLSECLPIYS
jgi:membrane-associated phospholipid phosphatase